MSSSVLGLGAAALGAANLGARSLGSKPGKMVKVSQPSREDYMQGYSSMLRGPNKKLYSEDERIKAAFGNAPIIGGTGEFYYGGMPKKIPQGYTLMRGPDVGIPGPMIKGQSYGSTKETYRLVQLPTAPQQEQPQPIPQPQLKLDLTQGGKKNVLNSTDIKHAQQQGISRKEIKRAVKSQDIRMSAKAKARLYKDKKKKDKKNKD